jgi:hypothetical protein
MSPFFKHLLLNLALSLRSEEKAENVPRITEMQAVSV